MLLGKPDTELLCILKLTCEVAGGQQADMTFDSQTIQLSNCSSCKANTDWKMKSDNADAGDANTNIPDYFRCIMNRAANRSEPGINAKYTQ